MGINLTSYRFERYKASPSQSRQKGKEQETMQQPILILGEQLKQLVVWVQWLRRLQEEVQVEREDPPLQVTGELLPQRPLLPSLPCPYPLEARSQEG